jgi:tRNA(Glu) U13 pseudouridine synthase TruD
VILRVEPGDPAVSEEPCSTAGQMALRLRFALPAGSYATVVVAELLGGPASAAESAPETADAGDDAPTETAV